VVKKHVEKCSTSLTIKEMQIKPTLRFLLTLVRIATIKKTKNNKSCHDAGKKQPSYTIGMNII
jgi:hypothetical protein